MTWRTFFVAAGIFNFAAGLPLLIIPDVMLSTLGVAAPEDLLFHRMAGLLIVCFGVIYVLIGREPTRYRPLAWLGIAGKAGVVVLFTQAWIAGGVPAPAFAVSLGDLAFGAGFLVFVLTYKDA